MLRADENERAVFVTCRGPIVNVITCRRRHHHRPVLAVDIKTIAVKTSRKHLLHMRCLRATYDSLHECVLYDDL